MSLVSQRPSMGARENRKQIFDVYYIVDWLNASFPTLNVTPEHIKTPASEDVCEIYGVITQQILGLSTAALTMLPFDANAEVADCEILSRATPKLVVFQFLSAFIEDLTEGQITVTLGDLLMPDPRRTRRMLSILIDYLQFSEEANKEVNRAFAAHDRKGAELEARRNAVVQKEQEIANLRSQHEYRKRDGNEKRAELEQLCQKTRQTMQENTSIQSSFQAIADEISEKTKRIEELESELKSVMIHNEVLTSKLVTSPERLESEVKDAAERKEIAIKKFDVKRRELRAEVEKRRERALVGNEIAKHEEQLQHILSYEAKKTAMEEKLCAAKDLRSKLDDELTSLQNLLVKEQDAVKKRDMAFEYECDNHVVQLRNYNEQFSTVGRHIAEMRRRLNEVNKENMVVQREIGKLKDSLSAMNRIAEAESIKIAHRFKGVMQKLNDARRAYDDEWRLLEGVLLMVEESRHADGQEHSDTISLRSKNHSAKSNLLED